MFGGVSDLARLLGQGRFDLSNEASLQADIQAFLAEHMPAEAISREHRLDARDRPDFLLFGCWVIEAKVKGAQRAAIVRQLERYAAHDVVAGIVLATNVSMSLPPLLGGKPIAVVGLGRAWL